PDPADVTLLPGLLDSFASIHVAESPPAPETVRERRRSSPAVVGYAHSSVQQGGLALREAAFERATRAAPRADAVTVALVTADPTRAQRLRTALERAPLTTIPREIQVHEAPSRRELRKLLTQEADLLVLDLPASERTIGCRDGVLDLSNVDGVEARVVVLGATSADPAVVSTLAQAGATGAAVTPDVTTPKQGLELVGCLLRGQPLPTAVAMFHGGDYALAGSPVAVAARLDREINSACFYADTVGPDEHRLRYETHPTRRYGQGSVNIPPSEYGHSEFQLVGTVTTMPSTVSTDELLELLCDDESIVVLNGVVYAGAVEPTRSLVEQSAQRALEASPDRAADATDRRPNG
ncbi:MAG: hypothetical protein ABEI57_03170, partial [Halapricum sp.]